MALELYEFDDPATYADFVGLLAEDPDLLALVGRIEAGWREETPGGGVHWLYYCPSAKTTKLAQRPKTAAEIASEAAANPGGRPGKFKTTIETKGEGGWVVVAPSGGTVHPSGRPYRLTSGGPESIVTLAEDERATLHAFALGFDRRPIREYSRSTVGSATGVRHDDLPGADFDRRGEWATVLEPAGWTRLQRGGSIEYWCRPGKSGTVSASVNWGGHGLLKVFSSSTELDTERCYTRFGAFAVLHHGGDFKAAARALRAQGFGGGAKMKTTAARAGPGRPTTPEPEPEPDPEPEPPRVPPVPGEPERYEMPEPGGSSPAPERYEDPSTATPDDDADADAGTEVFERGDEAELGEDLFARLGGVDHAVHDEGELRQVDEAGLWHVIDSYRLLRMARAYGGRMRWTVGRDGQSTTAPIRLSAAAGKGAAAFAIAEAHREGWWSDAPEGAAFARSFARVDGTRIVVEPLRAEHRVRAEAATEWDLPPKQPTPTTSRLLEETWAGCPDMEERVTYLMEWLGAALVGHATRYKMSPLLVGPKDTGKSAVLIVVASCFPLATHRSVTMHSMAQPFSRARLVGGRINVVNELPSRSVLDSEEAKAILSGDPVAACQKYEREFTLRARMGHVFAANHLPPTLDRALVERFVVLDCPHIVPADRQDRDLARKLRAESPAVARLALTMYELALQDGALDYGLTVPSSSRARLDEWVELSDNVAAWAGERLRSAEKGGIKSTQLYQEYRRWCDDDGHKPTAHNTWSQRLGELGFTRAHRADGTWWLVQRVGDATVEAEERWGT